MSVVFVDLNLDDPAIHPFLHDVLTEYVPSYMATQVNLSQQAHQIRAQEILDYATADLVFMFTFYSHLRRHPSGPELRVRYSTFDRKHLLINLADSHMYLAHSSNASFCW
jgi:hypothetical protein